MQRSSPAEIFKNRFVAFESQTLKYLSGLYETPKKDVDKYVKKINKVIQTVIKSGMRALKNNGEMKCADITEMLQKLENFFKSFFTIANTLHGSVKMHRAVIDEELEITIQLFNDIGDDNKCADNRLNNLSPSKMRRNGTLTARFDQDEDYISGSSYGRARATATNDTGFDFVPSNNTDTKARAGSDDGMNTFSPFANGLASVPFSPSEPEVNMSWSKTATIRSGPDGKDIIVREVQSPVMSFSPSKNMQSPPRNGFASSMAATNNANTPSIVALDQTTQSPSKFTF